MIPVTNPGKILLLPMCGLGDAVCYLPYVHAIRRRFPTAHIAALVVSDVAQTILESAGCDIEVTVFNRAKQSGLRALLSVLRQIRRFQYDIVFSGAHPNSVRVPLLAALSGAKIRVGAKMERYSFLYNRRIDVRTDAHAYERFRQLLTAVGIEMPASEYIPCLELAPEARDAAMALWDEAGLHKAECVIGIASGADSNARGPWKPYRKRWSSERYAEIVRWLAQEKRARVVMFGGKDEAVLAEQIAISSGVPIINFCGKTGIQELSWLLSQCTALLSNDTGVMHVGAAVGTPVIALFGPTSPLAFGPIGERHRILQGKARCSPCYPFPTCNLTGCSAMDDITSEQVRECLADVLNVGDPVLGSPVASAQLIQIGNARA
jgi:lipopolysaccharide heptosyltransferase II